MAKVPHAEAISNLDKPKGMHAPTWLRVKALLRLLSSHGDDIYPSLMTLARRSGLPKATVVRLLARAEMEGFIDRVDRPLDDSWRVGTTYRLLMETGPIMGSKLDPNKRKRTSSSSKRSLSSRATGGLASAAPTHLGNRYSGKCYVCERPVPAGEGVLHGRDPVHRDCEATMMNRDWQRQQAEDFNGPSTFGEDPQAPLPSLSPTKVHPAARLAYRFERHWYDEVVPRHPELLQHGCIILGPAIGYIKKTFLSNGYSPDHVEAYFQAFFDELVYPSGPLRVRDHQTVWQLFTGWWPHSVVPDPAIEQAAQAQAQAVSAVLQDESARRDAAWARIMAADQADPEDWKIVRGQA